MASSWTGLPNMEGKLFDNGKLKIDKMLGSGGGGDVYGGFNPLEPDNKIAIKFGRAGQGTSTLDHEFSIYKTLEGISGIPKVQCMRKCVGGKYCMILMDLLGKSLHDLMADWGGTLSLKTVLKLSVKIIETLEKIHLKGVVHADIKPKNLMMGNGANKNKLVIIDYGLARMYQDPITKNMVPYQNGIHLQGSSIFASLAAHERGTLSPKDDLESLGFTILYLLKGGVLPWNSKEINQIKSVPNRWERVKIMKVDFLKTLPHCPEFSEMSKYFEHCQGLKYTETPNYDFLKTLLKQLLLQKTGIQYENVKYKWDE